MKSDDRRIGFRVDGVTIKAIQREIARLEAATPGLRATISSAARAMILRAAEGEDLKIKRT